MKRFHSTVLSLALAAGVLHAAPSDTNAKTPIATPPAEKPPEPVITLRVGDQAPGLQFSRWIKGKPIEKIETGKIYVFEFWATWCGPCRGAMPHLSELAQKYGDKVTVVGVNVWENPRGAADAPFLPKIESFVRHAGDMMAYNVAVDTTAGSDGYFAKNWLTAAGQRGIPSTFVIDRRGRVAWIGHPLLGLEEAIGLALENRLDAAAAQKIKDDYKKIAARSGDLRKELQAMQTSADPAAIVAAAEKAMQENPLVGDTARPMKYLALARQDQEKARAYAEEIMEQHRTAPFVLGALARAALADDNPNRDPALAIKLMLTAGKTAAEYDLATAPLLAEAYFKAGQKDKAVALQQGIVDSLTDPNLARALEKQKEALAKYKGPSA